MILFLLASVLAQGGFTLEGTDNWDGMGMSVFFLTDITGDGVPEVGTSAFCTDLNGTNSGSLSIYDGATHARLRRHDGESAHARLGEDANNCGDVDRDGIADYIVGARREDHGYQNSGSAYVWSGRTGALLHRFDGVEENSNFGVSVNGASDLDGDGYMELIIGADNEDNERGAVYIFSGRTGQLLRSVKGLQEGDRLGASVSGVGDATGDGFPDYLIAAPFYDNGRGKVYLVNGQNHNLVRAWGGAAPEVQFGSAVSEARDTNGDGVGDVLIGAPCEDRVYLYSGLTGELLHTFDGTPGPTKQGLGHSVAFGGDLDQDGYADVILGARGVWENIDYVSGGGTLFAYSGLTGNLLFQYQGDADDDAFASAVFGRGFDMNGDLVPDIIVGAPAAGDLGIHAPGQVKVFYTDL